MIHSSLISEKNELEAEEILICNAFSQEKYETRVYRELARALGVEGKSQLEIRSILRAFRSQTELQSLSSDEARKHLHV